MRKVWIATSVYVLVFSSLEAYRWHIWSFGSDTGTFTQAILDAAHGFRDGPEGGSHFFFHFSPILALLYPLVALTHSPLALQVAQVVLVALVAPALFVLVRPYLDERVSVRVAIISLLYAPLASLAFGEFHELAFFPLFAVGLLWAADQGKWWWFAACGAGALLTREDVCLELTIIGIGLAACALARRPAEEQSFLAGMFRRPRTTALAFASLGLASMLVAIGYYREVFAIYGAWPHGHFYDYPFASGPPAVIASLFEKPLVVLPAVLTIGRLTYVLEALAPLVFLPVRSWWSLLALPGFGVVLLASEQSVWRMGNHYAAMWAPWLLVGATAAIAGIEQRRGIKAALAWVNAALIACAVALIAFNPMHLAHYLSPPYADIASARAALACVPRDASVSTHDEWFAEIAASYPKATILATSGLDYLVYADDFPNDRFRLLSRPLLASDVATGQYSVVCREGRVNVYRKRVPNAH